MSTQQCNLSFLVPGASASELRSYALEDALILQSAFLVEHLLSLRPHSPSLVISCRVCAILPLLAKQLNPSLNPKSSDPLRVFFEVVLEVRHTYFYH